MVSVIKITLVNTLLHSIFTKQNERDKMQQLLQEVWQFLKKLNLVSPQDPAIPLLSVFHKKLKGGTQKKKKKKKKKRNQVLK